MAVSAFLLIAVVVGVNAAVAAAPTVTTDTPTGVGYTTAQVAGTVNPNGGPASITVYAESRPVGGSWSYKQIQTIEGAEAEGTDPIPVEAELTGLKAGTEHEVRFDAYTEGVEIYSSEPYPKFTTLDLPAPTFSVDPVTEITGTSAQLNATINPGGADPAFDVQYQFEYSIDQSSWLFAGQGTVPAGEVDEPVFKELQALQPNTTYYVRLKVGNAGGEYESPLPNASFTTAAQAPGIESLPAATYPGGTAAALGGYVNPKNSATTYWIEYGPTASYGTSLPPSKDASAGDKGQPVAISRLVSGLSPETTYHFRLVADNGAGTSAGPDMTFETGPAATPVQGDCPNEAFRIEQGATFLPDCRAWEKVTPADKGGVDVGGVTYESKARAAAAGGKLVFTSVGQFAEPKAGGFPGDYFAERGANGWTTRSMLPPNTAKAGLIEWPGAAVGRTSALLSVDDELDSFFIEGTAPIAPGTKDGVPVIYKQAGIDAPFELVSPAGPDYDEALLARLMNLAGAPVYLTASQNMRFALFIAAWDFETGTATFNDRLYKADTLTGEIEQVGILPGGDEAASPYPGSLYRSMRNAVSGDGERVFFCDNGCNSAEDLYLREDGETSLISKVARFWAATTDGSQVLYQQARSEIDGTDGGVFIQDVESGEERRISEGTGVDSITTVVAAADDLSYVYFVTREGPLVPGWDGSGSASDALYVWHDDGDEGEVRLVANLTGFQEDDRDSVARDVYAYKPHLPGFDNNPWAASAPGGERLVFTTARNVTGYDSGPYRQVYLYDFNADTVNCISCPRGSAQGDAQLIFPNQATQQVSTNSRPLGMRNFISRDEKRIFFKSPEALVEEDTNGVEDVYMYEDGQIRLLSSGTSDSPAVFLAADASGDEVFIATAAKLLRGDKDELVDIYAARVGGGFPQPADPQPECQGEACQGAAPLAPRGASPASGSVSGSGNAPIKRAKCVKPKKKKKHKAKKGKAAGKKRGASKAAGSKAAPKKNKGKGKKKPTPCKPGAGK